MLDEIEVEFDEEVVERFGARWQAGETWSCEELEQRFRLFIFHSFCDHCWVDADGPVQIFVKKLDKVHEFVIVLAIAGFGILEQVFNAASQ